MRLLKTQEMNTEFYLENTNPTVPKEDDGTDAASPYVTADETHARTQLCDIGHATGSKTRMHSTSVFCLLQFVGLAERTCWFDPSEPFLCCSATY